MDEKEKRNILEKWYEENFALVVGDYSEVKAKIRSTFLDRFMIMEQLIDTIIVAELFPHENEGREKLLSCVLYVDELTFSSKVKILSNLMKNRTDGILSKYPKLFNKISRIRRLRNKLAHSMFDNLWDISIGRVYEDKIKMEMLEGGYIKEEFLTIKELEEYKEDIESVWKDLISLRDIIEGKEEEKLE